MVAFDNVFETKPDYINEQGVKWWYDKNITEYAKNIKLDDIMVWFTEELNGRKSRVIIYKNNVEYASPVLEEICCHLDIMKLSQKL